MVTFKKKSLFEKPESLGQKLNNAREKKLLSIDKVVKDTGIKKKYIRSLENNDFKNLPGGLYIKKFITQYGKYLNIEQEELDKYLKENLQNQDKKKVYFSHKKISKKRFLVFPRIVRTVLIGVVVLAFLLYLGFYFNNLISPPQLNITYPSNNETVTKNPIVIKGETEPETEVYINGTIVLTENNGYFQKEINLKKGLNKITIEAKQRYSRTNTKTRQIKLE